MRYDTPLLLENWQEGIDSFRVENRLPSTQVLHSLDRNRSRTAETDRDPREVDVLHPHSNRRLRLVGRHEPPTELCARMHIPPWRPRTETRIFGWT